jgi:hypothetical protein
MNTVKPKDNMSFATARENMATVKQSKFVDVAQLEDAEDRD